jgi:hypothetical protein
MAALGLATGGTKIGHPVPPKRPYESPKITFLGGNSADFQGIATDRFLSEAFGKPLEDLL